MKTFALFVYPAWGVILLAPLLAALFYLLIKKYNLKIKKHALWTSSIILGVTLTEPLHGITFTNHITNLLVEAFSYFAYCYLVMNIRDIPIHKILRAIIWSLASLPILGLYFLTTIGFFGFMFIAADLFFPGKDMPTEPGFICTKYTWGAAFTDGGYSLSLYKKVPYLPFIKINRASVSVNESVWNPKDTLPTCQSLQLQ